MNNGIFDFRKKIAFAAALLFVSHTLYSLPAAEAAAAVMPTADMHPTAAQEENEPDMQTEEYTVTFVNHTVSKADYAQLVYKLFGPDVRHSYEDWNATGTITAAYGAEPSNDKMAVGEYIYKTPTGDTATVLMDGSAVEKAEAQYYQDDSGKAQYVVSLTLNEEGAKTFQEITTTYLNQTVSIWMDDIMLSAPTVQATITDGKAQISGSFTAKEATELAQKINAGALPFQLETANYGNISATLGENALTAMAYAAVVAFILIALIMIIFYRLPGFVAIIALIGQMGLTVAAVSGYFPAFPSFTMTLPGIAGMILSIGMGVDCNVITAERIKEELRGGRTLDGALDKGSKNSLSAIVDGNMTVVIVSIILMLVFGPSNILSFIFGESTTGTIYAFGYTLLVGVISNFIMGIFFSRLMLRSIAGIKPLRKNWLFGGAKDEK